MKRDYRKSPCNVNFAGKLPGAFETKRIAGRHRLTYKTCQGHFGGVSKKYTGPLVLNWLASPERRNETIQQMAKQARSL